MAKTVIEQRIDEFKIEKLLFQRKSMYILTLYHTTLMMLR